MSDFQLTASLFYSPLLHQMDLLTWKACHTPPQLKNALGSAACGVKSTLPSRAQNCSVKTTFRSPQSKSNATSNRKQKRKSSTNINYTVKSWQPWEKKLRRGYIIISRLHPVGVFLFCFVLFLKFIFFHEKTFISKRRKSNISWSTYTMPGIRLNALFTFSYFEGNL